MKAATLATLYGMIGGVLSGMFVSAVTPGNNSFAVWTSSALGGMLFSSLATLMWVKD